MSRGESTCLPGRPAGELGLKEGIERGIERGRSEDLLVSPMVLLEVEYLFETGRINAKAAEVYDYLHDTIELDGCAKPFAAVARKSIGMKWTRDPFDRLITAQAAVDDSPLLTKDDTIHTYYPEAVW